VTFLLYRAVMS